MSKLVIYIANPYSSKLENKDAAALERIHRRHLESYVGGVLRKRYKHAFILPIALSASMADICTFGTGFDEWEGDDLEFINRSDEVWVLMSNGWDVSQGVKAEIEHAIKTGKPVKYIDPVTLEVRNDK